MSMELGYDVLAHGGTGTGDVAAPASGATITLWDSGAAETGTQSALHGGRKWKRIIVNIYSSHASDTSGLKFQESSDGGTNWRTVVEYTVSATTYTKNYIAMSGRRIRVTYTNSANTLTTWEMDVFGDTHERGTVV